MVKIDFLLHWSRITIFIIARIGLGLQPSAIIGS